MSFYQNRLLLSKLKLHSKSISDMFQKLMSGGIKIHDCKIYISAPEAKVVFRGAVGKGDLVLVWSRIIIIV